MDQRNSASRLQVFLTWPFLVSLAILLLNDYYLKATYSNWITGKLSDFAGIFAVSLVLFALVPRSRRLSGLLLTVLFVVWKSPFATPVIEMVRASGIAGFGRVVDYSDLIALTVIPVAALIARSSTPATLVRPRVRTAFAIPAIAVFVFAVTGTSIATFSHDYTIRTTDPNGAIDPHTVLKVVNAVAEEYKLERTDGDETSLSGTFAHKHFSVKYSIDSNGRLEIGTRAPTDEEKKLDRFKKTLRSELGRTFDDLEIVESIP